MSELPSLFAPAQADDENDGDVRAAIVEFTPTVIRIRELSAQHFALVDGSDRQAVEEEIASLTADVATRAGRLALTLDDLFRLINAELRTSRADTKAPHGDYLRHLCDTSTGAYGDRRQIRRELDRLQDNLKRSDDQCLQADRACAGFVAGWPDRTGRA
ncbi:hypothetical protein [Sphingomonas sp. Leaf4]|uniref:hypothetical protein n=1 Tax=Sphingomonas sp. Leaf4 TaxID=2876553 RepID=UPI001E47EAF1|nr:hypothetical protein [Sphingomonas sp. Leaf4]